MPPHTGAYLCDNGGTSHTSRRMRDMLLRVTDRGLYCEAADCFIDPWAPVDRAIVTHAHGDHLTWGCGSYLVTNDGLGVTRERLGQDAPKVQGIAYGESRTINGVKFSLHPAGHILGSAQIRVEYAGEVWVVSGDYKTDADATCAPWEPVRCHTFVTESTFGMPLYHWPTQQSVFDSINSWWRNNAAEGRASLLFGYALGKAQRLLSGLDASIGPVLTHGSVERMTQCYRTAGIALPPTANATLSTREESWSRAMIVAPPSAAGSTWTRRFGNPSTAFASGWMHVRGARRRRSVDRGFTLSMPRARNVYLLRTGSVKSSCVGCGSTDWKHTCSRRDMRASAMTLRRRRRTCAKPRTCVQTSQRLMNVSLLVLLMLLLMNLASPTPPCLNFSEAICRTVRCD